MFGDLKLLSLKLCVIVTEFLILFVSDNWSSLCFVSGQCHSADWRFARNPDAATAEGT